MLEIPGLSEYGVLGISCVVLLTTVGALWKRISQIQDSRIEDAKFYNDKIFQLAREMDSTLNALKAVVEGIRHV